MAILRLKHKGNGIGISLMQFNRQNDNPRLCFKYSTYVFTIPIFSKRDRITQGSLLHFEAHNKNYFLFKTTTIESHSSISE